jgi:hypothetical protein
MNTINMPGFTAEDSLSMTSGHYQTDRHAIKSSTQMISAIYAAAQGQDFPGTTCTCKGCASNGGDLTGQCSSVCKDKTVYSKGSEPYDYCKAVRVLPWWENVAWHVPGGGQVIWW